MDLKRCSKPTGGGCGKLLPIYKFSVDRHNKTDGLQLKCKACQKEYRARPEVKKRKAYDQTPEAKARQKAYRETPERKARQKAWRKTNRGKVNAYNARRKADRRKATPPWAKGDKRIVAMYDLAVALSISEGVPIEVDHIHPSSHNGANDFQNMQLLTASDNSAKGDKLPAAWRDYKERRLACLAA